MIVAGVIVGFVAYSVSAPTSDLAGLFGIVIGLLTTLVVAQLVESYRHSQDISKTNLHVVNLLQKIGEKQQEAGIRTKCIFKKKIDTTSMLRAGTERIETLDFDVIDSKYVWLTILDKNRKIKYGKVVFGKEECDRYKRFYDYLFEEAEDVE